MDTHRLRYFLCVAEEGSINGAACVLGITQPVLSRQVRLLEEDLGVTLFRRTSRGVELTEEGDRLRQTAAAPLRQLELAMRYAGSPTARIERGLHLGLPVAVAPILAPPLLRSLITAFPGVDMRVTVANDEALVAGLLDGTVDIAVITPTPDDRLFYQDLLEENLVIVGGATSRLPPERPVDFAGITALPLILPLPDSGIRTVLENTALRLGVKLFSRFSTDSLEVTKSLVSAGYGYAVLPFSAYAREIAEKCVNHAPLKDLTQQWGIAVTSRLELPGGFVIKVNLIIREEATRLVKARAWTARLLPPKRTDPA